MPLPGQARRQGLRALRGPLALALRRGYNPRVNDTPRRSPRADLALILLAACAAGASAKGVTFTPTITKTFKNEPCAAAGICELRSFSIHNYEYVVEFDQYRTHNYGSTVNIEYVTRTPASLEDFAVVNFIRGCQFDTEFKGGKVERHYTILVGSFGENVKYLFPRWRIDSLDVNPMYNNTSPAEAARSGTLHGSYRWNRVKGSFAKDSEVLFGDERPVEGRLYVSDRPGTAFVSDDGERATNISLQFRTCLYRTRDMPSVATPEDVDFAAPIACHEWASSYVYDFFRKEMTHPKELDCGPTE